MLFFGATGGFTSTSSPSSGSRRPWRRSIARLCAAVTSHLPEPPEAERNSPHGRTLPARRARLYLRHKRAPPPEGLSPSPPGGVLERLFSFRHRFFPVKRPFESLRILRAIRFPRRTAELLALELRRVFPFALFTSLRLPSPLEPSPCPRVNGFPPGTRNTRLHYFSRA